MNRRLAWLGLGLGIALGACGRATRNPQPAPVLAEGGCASDCPSGGAPANDAAGNPSEVVSGSFTVAGTFSTSAAAGAAGAADDTVTPPTCRQGDFAACAGRNLYECLASNTAGVLKQECGDQAHCYAEAGGAMCVADVCVKGQTACINNVIKTCGDSGLYAERGTDCGDQACSGNTCQPRICQPNSDFCRDGDVHECLGQGASSQIVKSCPPGSACRDVGVPDCVVLACVPDSVACVNNQIGKCTTEGDALGSVDQDCAEQGQVCDVAGACSPSVVDVLGRADKTQIPAGGVFDFIDVHSSRRVTKVEINLRPQDVDVNLHWSINGKQVFVEANSIAHPGDTTASTTELNAVLEAGEHYSIGASADGGEADYYAPGALPVVSFGTVDLPENTGAVFAMRITTELP